MFSFSECFMCSCVFCLFTSFLLVFFVFIWEELSFIESNQQICDALRDLVPFVQFKKREKQPSRSVTFSKVAGLSLQLY